MSNKYCLVKDKEKDTTSMLYLYSCNDCPHFGSYNNLSICTKYADDTNDINIIEDVSEITFLNGQKTVYYKIPDWCRLSTSKSDNFLTDLEACDEVKNVENYNQKSYISTYKKEDNYLVCSSCNVKEESVLRRTNYGMCSKCLELSRFDLVLLNKAKLSNFKLKRLERKKYNDYSYFNYDNYCF
ncbi:MAG: hypothetical protein WCK10_03115 [Candidatus Staskawiczbacteria bacterium]